MIELSFLCVIDQNHVLKTQLAREWQISKLENRTHFRHT